jgi:hypothetical protein
MNAFTFKTTFRALLLTFLFLASSSRCLALREILVLNRNDASAMGIEVRTKAAGAGPVVRVELEFKPEGKLKQFTHVELNVTEGEKSLIFFGGLRETRTNSGGVIVTFSAGRAFLEKSALSIVVRDPREAGDHTFELRMKDFLDNERVR